MRLRERVSLAVAGAADETVLRALRTACDRGWVSPLLVGGKEDIARLAGEHGISLDGMTILDSDDPAAEAVAQVRSGRAQLLMKGQIATPALMRAVLSGATGLRTGRVICQVVLMEIAPGGRRVPAGGHRHHSSTGVEGKDRNPAKCRGSGTGAG